MNRLISAIEAAKLVGVTKKVIYDADELKPALHKPRVYKREDVERFARQFQTTQSGKQRRRPRKPKKPQGDV